MSQVSRTILFARRIKALGFRVFVAKLGAGDYGFITDAEGTRVLGFNINDDTLSGKYGPPSRESGTSWVLDTYPSALLSAEDVHAALYAMPPFCGLGWKHLSTLAQYLKDYDASSRFVELSE